MEILRENMLPGNKPWIGKCNSCGSIMRAVRGELGTVMPGDYHSDYEQWSWATCAVCHKPKSVCFYEENSASGKRVKAELIG